MADPIDHTEQLCQLTARTEALMQKVRQLQTEKEELGKEVEMLKRRVRKLKAENEQLHEERAQMARAGQRRAVSSNGEEP